MKNCLNPCYLTPREVGKIWKMYLFVHKILKKEKKKDNKFYKNNKKWLKSIPKIKNKKKLKNLDLLIL